MLSRRKLLGSTLKISAGLALAPRKAIFAETAVPVIIRLNDSAPVNVPANFTGLGYEMSSVAPLGLLSPANRHYVALIKGLGGQGVLRAGGIVADYTHYEPDGTILAERQNTVITRAGLDQFAAFLKRVGWTAIWSLNFAQGALDDAVHEAGAVARALGPRLLALEIGNEVENYARGRTPFRKAPYDYKTYRAEYEQWHEAISRAVPGIRFAAPDTASFVDWVERMAMDANGKVQLLTTHYYRNNQLRGSADQLLFPDPRLKDVLTRLRAASQQRGIPWRICEANSFSGGGLPGVSDTFIGALWTLDFMFLLATYGCAGVNIETGVNQLGFISSYSPVQDDGKGTNSAGVPYYGMLAFAQAVAASNQLLPTDIESRGVNLTAYVLGSARTPRALVVINRDSSHDAHVSLAGSKMSHFTALRLISPSPDSKAGVTFGGATVDSAGHWRPVQEESVSGNSVFVPRMSAVVLRHPSIS
jgi:hypothetical protein